MSFKTHFFICRRKISLGQQQPGLWNSSHLQTTVLRRLSSLSWSLLNGSLRRVPLCTTHHSSTYRRGRGLLEAESLLPGASVLGQLRSRQLWAGPRTGPRQGDRYFCRSCPVSLHGPSVSVKVTRSLTLVTPWIPSPPRCPAPASGAAARGSASPGPPAPTPALGSRGPKSCAPASHTGPRQGAPRMAPRPAPQAAVPPPAPCSHPRGGCRSGCARPDGVGGSRGCSRCCGPSATASAWRRRPTGAARSAPCWNRLHVPPATPPSASGARRHLE